VGKRIVEVPGVRDSGYRVVKGSQTGMGLWQRAWDGVRAQARYRTVGKGLSRDQGMHGIS
jgi:hypothetical protein